jgi:hypothetical protein
LIDAAKKFTLFVELRYSTNAFFLAKLFSFSLSFRRSLADVVNGFHPLRLSNT